MRKRNAPVKRLKLGVKTGDRVEVLSGDWKGAEGVVRSVDRLKGRVVVDGVNFKTRHMRKSQRFPEGGIVEEEAPIHVSNVKVIEPSTES